MATTLRLVDLLKCLNENGVSYVIVGGVAALLHGSVRVTTDLDVCAPLGEPNLSRILNALRGINPRIRMRPDKMRLPETPERLQNLKNLYLDTDLGTLDLLGELPGVGAFDDVLKRSFEVDVSGLTCRVVDLDALIAAKRVANRPKDRLAIADLEVVRARRKGPTDRPMDEA